MRIHDPAFDHTLVLYPHLALFHAAAFLFTRDGILDSSQTLYTSL